MPDTKLRIGRCAIWFSIIVLALSVAIAHANGPADSDASAPKPFKLGDLIEPFTPPTLAEVDKTAHWIDGPVLSGMEIQRKKQAAAGPPPVSVAEALRLRYDGPESNAKILGTLGRLAPPDNAGVDFDGVMVRHVAGDMKSSNPLLFSTVTEAEYQQLTSFPGLTTFDQDFRFFAPSDMIVSWQTSADHKMDKLVLRDDLTWSDGKPFTAKDIEFSFQVIMTGAVPILAVRTGTDQIKWVEAYDDHTVVVFHKEAYATNTENLNFPVIPKHVYEKSLPDDPTMARSDYHTRLEDHPVVSGAYELVSRTRNQEFVLRRRESYYMHNGKQVRPKPYFREVRVKVIEDLNTALLALKAGQIDEMEFRPEQWVSQTTGDDFYKLNTKVTAPEWTEFHFTWNMKSPYFEDKRVRQAMSYAFDYDEFLKKITRNIYQPCQGTFHPDAWYFPKNGGPKPYQQDLDKAEDLLDAAGWKDTDGDGIRDKMINGHRVPFEFSLLTFQNETGIQCATLMKECLAKIGITCNVKPTEFTVLYDSVEHHKFDASMAGLGCGTDPDLTSNIFATGEARNDSQYSNKRVDELFVLGRKEFDRDKRAAIYGEIANILWEDQPYTWLFYRNAFFGFNKNLRGYNFSPKGPFDFSPGFDSIYRATAAP
ncbi:MAG TPA: ABC transporter substrate-binding protein [Lacipirellulaceae bacterium]|jgi:peptide/nickel transport system substrate-binding protein|nr:ABC transporter substrate-binding protein [Lacipirellulaceae bacterium]